jgi:hypothetical protein
MRHIIGVHHRSVVARLHDVDSLFDQLNVLAEDHQDPCRQTTHFFAGFKVELCQCIVYEKRFVFPQIDRWEARCVVSPFSPPSDALLRAAKDLAHWHARLFTLSRKLVRQVRALGLSEKPTGGSLPDELLSGLAAFCDQFYQQLFEEDCLLLPRITSWRAPNNRAERQLCRPD